MLTRTYAQRVPPRRNVTSRYAATGLLVTYRYRRNQTCAAAPWIGHVTHVSADATVASLYDKPPWTACVLSYANVAPAPIDTTVNDHRRGWRRRWRG